jgi:hypothetical protein
MVLTTLKPRANTVCRAFARPNKVILQRPDPKGRFGQFGGRYVPEALIPALNDLEKSFYEAQDDASLSSTVVAEATKM